MSGADGRRRPSASHEPWRAAGLRKGRRYGISHQAIDRATERRLAGDWRGACAAAGIDVELDLDAIRNDHGTEFTEQLLDDLHHLVPDLARLHMPRSWKGLGLLLPEQPALLSRPGGPDGPWLTLGVGPHYHPWLRGPVLKVGRMSVIPDYNPHHPMREQPALDRWKISSFTAHWAGLPHVWETSRHLWDTRHVHEMRERWGGGPDRAPFLNADGTPRAAGELPTGDPGPGDPAARTEWIDGLHQAGQVVEAFTAAGIGFDPGPVSVEAAARLPFSPARIPGEFRRLAAAGLGDRFQIPYDKHTTVLIALDKGTVRVEFAEFDLDTASGIPAMSEVCWARPPDIDVLRDGMSPDELHPLVREAIAPDHVPGAPPEPAFADRSPVRVRCRDEWHEVIPSPVGLRIPHDDEETNREASLRALGGNSTGCFAVREAWSTGEGRLPQALRKRRDDLFGWVRQRDTRAVLHYLDRGGDPDIRDGKGRALLHHLAFLNHEVLLPRLLEAGADVNAEDRDGRTPLDVFDQVAGGLREDTVARRTLVAAGAVAKDPEEFQAWRLRASAGSSDDPPF
ncbi:ankyrin repeat domain-containing protein [Nocardiopsis flavescens]|nr:ankyrin repeat domain-containing protein [Nocardiopsis flavescens]